MDRHLHGFVSCKQELDRKRIGVAQLLCARGDHQLTHGQRLLPKSLGIDKSEIQVHKRIEGCFWPKMAGKIETGKIYGKLSRKATDQLIGVVTITPQIVEKANLRLQAARTHPELRGEERDNALRDVIGHDGTRQDPSFVSEPRPATLALWATSTMDVGAIGAVFSRTVRAPEHVYVLEVVVARQIRSPDVELSVWVNESRFGRALTHRIAPLRSNAFWFSCRHLLTPAQLNASLPGQRPGSGLSAASRD